MSAPRRKHRPPPPIDLSWRPESYVDFGDPVQAILSGIKGSRRREMVRDVLRRESEAGRALAEALEGGLAQGLLNESASESFVDFMSARGDPSWMGGEFLLDLRRNEVEIARVATASVTADVISYRARWSGGRYHYSACDEYDREIALPRRTSRRPLTLGEVADLVGRSWCPDFDPDWHGYLPGVLWHLAYEAWGRPARESTGMAWVESEIYPQLQSVFRSRAEEWIREREGNPDA